MTKLAPSMPSGQSLSATALATHHHFNCDLYIYNVYHGSSSSTHDADTPEFELSKAQFQRGIEWEETLFSWLDHSNLLLKVPSVPIDAETLLENIHADERYHFFLAGLNFWPPMDKLQARFFEAGSEPVKFGLAKPDLLEITRTEDSIIWKVIDAKASKSVKTPHHIQIYFYTLCLSHILPQPLFQNAGNAGIWLPPVEGYNKAIPTVDDIRSMDISLLAPAINQFLFSRLPRILHAPRQNVSWHYNPLCRGCDYETECRPNAQHEHTFGSMPNISIGDAQTLKELLRLTQYRHQSKDIVGKPLSDIEDLHQLLSDPSSIHRLDVSSPSISKKSRRILYLPPRKEREQPINSPIVESIRANRIQIIPRLDYTCPAEEDVAVILSLMIDPSSPDTGIERFCVNLYSNIELTLPSIIHGPRERLISGLASIIRELSSTSPAPRTQFYVWSAGEQTALQSHIVHSALISTDNLDDIRLCIAALAQGASLLQTIFQPLLLSGALLSFLAKKQRRKAEYQACLERMGLSTSGTVDDMRKRLQAKFEELQTSEAKSASNSERQRELGQLHRVVILKREVERLMAIPVPGYWDLPECAFVLLNAKDDGFQYPSDEDIFRFYRNQNSVNQLEDALSKRNSGIYSVLKNFRYRVSSHKLLVNNARVLSTGFLDICKEEHLRKLFFMQQFEVLSKLSELWESRIGGCPDAPVLEFLRVQGSDYIFRLVSGIIDVAPERDRPMYDKLLALDTAITNGSQEDIPVEALFDDLAVSGLVFPLNRYTWMHWDKQHKRVKDELLTADVGNVAISGMDTLVTLKIWGSWKSNLELGRRYRLSPRLVDFNTTKVLSALFDLDLQFSSNDTIAQEGNRHRWVPYLQLLLDPKSLGGINRSQEYLKVEGSIQRLFRQLYDLGTRPAASLILKPSQHKAAQRILSNRLSVIWGPPGTGKTHTVTLSIMRLLEVEHRLLINGTRIIFITAMTHAAIAACQSRLERLIECYKQIEALPASWLDRVRIEEVRQGSDHPAPSSNPTRIYIYTGTIYQLYNFTRKRSFEVNCVVVDEAGQIPFASLSLVLRSLSSSARIIVAGDSEQLAPILSAQYPQLKTRQLFGSILDSVMPTRDRSSTDDDDSQIISSQDSQETVVQLTENFRLNPDLGEFISTIYLRQFRPQKVQARQLALSLDKVQNDVGVSFGIQLEVMGAVQLFFTSLSKVMLRKSQTILVPPSVDYDPQSSDLSLTHHPVSLSLIRLRTWSSTSEHFGAERTVYAEAELAAALVISLKRCCPGEGIFVATPHRVQREAVKAALVRVFSVTNRLSPAQDDVDEVTVDTIERLQGSEAAFVICLFSASNSITSDLRFLLERRRLNVAISRAKTLCILVTSPEVLCPSIWALSNEETAKGYAFLKAYEKRAWSYDLSVDVDGLS